MRNAGIFVLVLVVAVGAGKVTDMRDFVQVDDMLFTREQYRKIFGKEWIDKPEVDDDFIRIDDMLLTKEQYRNLFGKEWPHKRDVEQDFIRVDDMLMTREQYRQLYGREPEEHKMLRQNDFIRVGDMLLTKEQYKLLYGKLGKNVQKRMEEGDVRVGDMILTKEQYEHLFGKSENVEKRMHEGDVRVGDMILTKEQYENLFGKHSEKREIEGFIRVGDMMLTKEQYEHLFGRTVEKRTEQHASDEDMTAKRNAHQTFEEGSGRKNRGVKESNLHVNAFKREERYKDHIRSGDMLLTKRQHEALFASEGDRSKRKAVHDLSLRWTDGVIPYEFYENDFSEWQKKDARVAFDFFEQETCLKFRPSTPNDVNKTVIRQGWGGCNSELGMVGGAQNVNLDDNGCRWFGLYLHEFGHAIGLVHEHQLPERDEYVDVLWNHVNPDMRQWFHKYSDSELRRYGVGYDLASVMHYELNAFSKLNMRAVRVRDRTRDDWIGRVYWKTLSFSDVKLINLMYSCNAHCPADIPCPEKGFINKDCKCVTPKEYFDHVCVNIQPDDQCLQWAMAGECGANPGFMNINCRKACNSCPKIPELHQVLKKDEQCWNTYVDQKQCDKWAREGACEQYPSTVKRWCRKSCNACNWEKGRCPNFNGDDAACDRWAAEGECEANPLHMKPQCADSCGTCDWKPKGDCANKASDAVCAEKDKAELCDTLDPWMLENCPSTCDTCGLNSGACENELSDKECLEGYLAGDCQQDPRRMKTKCAKTCNSCGWGKKGNCKDTFPEAEHCDSWAAYGYCDVNPGWMKLFCASSCDSCSYPKSVATSCTNTYGDDGKCTAWANAGECRSNPEYMKMNCAKACGTCYFTKPNACFDLYSDSECREWKAAGKCDADATWMLKSCTKTCGKCSNTDEESGKDETETTEIPETQEPEIEEGSCTDVYHDCKENAAKGWCDTVEWMRDGCRMTCGTCGADGDDGDDDGDDDDNGDTDEGNDGDEGQESTESPQGSCQDVYHDCAENHEKGWCDTVSWMRDGCGRTCGFCHDSNNKHDNDGNVTGCKDEYTECADWMKIGHCYVESVQDACPKSCQLC